MPYAQVKLYLTVKAAVIDFQLSHLEGQVKLV